MRISLLINNSINSWVQDHALGMHFISLGDTVPVRNKANFHSSSYIDFIVLASVMVVCTVNAFSDPPGAQPH